MGGSTFARVHFIDWLRVFAVLLLFPFHTLRVFNVEPFYVKAGALSPVVNDVLSFIGVWHMPLLFFLAGCSTYLALRKRRAGAYALERVARLLVPLVFGVFVLIPPQTWFGGRFNSGYSASYGHYLVSGDFLKWNIQDSGDYFGGFGVGQLWFILFLFFMSLVALPLVASAAGGRLQTAATRFSRWLARPVWWLLPVALFFLADAASLEIAGKNVLFYLFIFILGFFVMCDTAFVASAERYRWPAVAAGLGLAVFWALSGGLRDGLPDPSWQRAVLQLFGDAAVWLSMVGMIGLGRRYLDRPSPALRYLGEASYPLYILHQTVIVVLAFYVVQWALPAPAQAVGLFVLVVPATFVLYEMVRRVLPLRFLFGMRPRGPGRPATLAEPGPAGAPAAKGPRPTESAYAYATVPSTCAAAAPAAVPSSLSPTAEEETWNDR